MRMQRTDIGLILGILVGQMRKKLNLCPRLHQEGLLRLDDLDRHLSVAVIRILCPDDLTKGPLSNTFFDLVAIVDELTVRDDVVIVLIIIAIVERSLTLLLLCFLSRITFLIVHRVDVLVRVDQRHGQLHQGTIRGQSTHSRLEVRLLRRSAIRRPLVVDRLL